MQIRNLDLQKELEKTGFNEKESKIYVSLLELGGAYPSKIAEYSGLNRSTTYKILTDLSVRGLVNEIEKRNKYFYQIEKPEKIIRSLEQKVKRTEDELEKTKSLIPNIENLYSTLKNHPRVTYYEGTEGILSIYEDMLKQKKSYEMIAFSKVEAFETFFPKDFFKNFINTKIEKGISTRAIVTDTENNRSYSGRIFTNAPKELWPKTKFIPENTFMYNGEITLYGDSKISIVNFSKDQLTGIIIDDTALHGAMRTIFELSWNSSLVKQ